MASVKFQYFSDLHLEFYNENHNKIKRMFDIKTSHADVLLLAGDIGKPTAQSYAMFLNMMSPLFEKVFVITGNHEYYNTKLSMSEVDLLCREVCRTLPSQNTVFLQNDFNQLNEYIDIYGGTFWSYIPNDKKQYIAENINDYKYIMNFEPNHSNSLHEKAVDTLENYLTHKNKLKKTVVMSHHLPAKHLIDPCFKHMNNMNHAFASNISCANDKSIVAWVYGHTHKPHQDGKFFCNPIGYPNENRKWTLSAYFNVET